MERTTAAGPAAAAMAPRLVRHALDAAAVAAEVDRACAAHEAFRDVLAAYAEAAAPGARDARADADRLADGWIAGQREVRATARVLEDLDAPACAGRFRLACGPGPDWDRTAGAGPFATLAEAAAWFMDGGR